MKTKKILALLLVIVMLASVFAGCNNNPAEPTKGTEAPTKGTETPGTTAPTAGGEPVGDEKVWDFMSGDPVTLTVYPSSANAKSGLLEGTIADWLLENYNIKLEIWAYSAEKTVSILAGGDLPDIMYFANAADAENAILGKMLVNLEDHIPELPHVADNEVLQPALNYVRDYVSGGTGDVYVLPMNVGKASASPADTSKVAMKLYWDTYSAIGCPEMNTLEDTVEVFKQMQAKRPVAEDGTPVYALKLFYGYRKNYEATTTGFYALYGYSETELPYLIESDMVNGIYKSILDDDSLYRRGVKWYNTLMREGLIDPDSITTDRKTAYANTRAGYGLVGLQESTGFPAEGFYYAPIGDGSIYYSTNSAFGSAVSVGIGANTKNLEAALCYLDMISDIDAVMQFSQAPVGEMFDVVDGKAVLTDVYKNYLANPDGSVFKFKKGDEATAVNLGTVMNLGEVTSWGTSGKVELWPEATDITDQLPIYAQWRQDMGYNTWVELLEAKGALYRSSDLADVAKFAAAPDDDMALILSALQTTVIDYTWKMYYAETDAEFDALWDEMVATCKGLESDRVIQWRLDELAKAKEIKDGLMN